MTSKFKLSEDIRTDLVFDLVSSFRYLDKPEKIANFLEDLLTPTEIRNMSVRLRIAKLLLAGKSQREISTALHTSLVTTNKVSNWLRRSGKGFRNVVENLPIKWSKPSKLPKGPLEYHLPELIAASTLLVVSNKQDKVPKKLIQSIKSK